jgi:hypothetical protein
MDCRFPSLGSAPKFGLRLAALKMRSGQTPEGRTLRHQLRPVIGHPIVEGEHSFIGQGRHSSFDRRQSRLRVAFLTFAGPQWPKAKSCASVASIRYISWAALSIKMEL